MRAARVLSGGSTYTNWYYPQTTAEWTTETIPLSAYSDDALIRFRQRNGQCQNVFIDDIAVGTPAGIAANWLNNLHLGADYN